METESIGTTEDKWTSFEELMEAVKSTIGAPDVSELKPVPTTVTTSQSCGYILVCCPGARADVFFPSATERTSRLVKRPPALVSRMCPHAMSLSLCEGVCDAM